MRYSIYFASRFERKREGLGKAQNFKEKQLADFATEGITPKEPKNSIGNVHVSAL